MTDSGEPRPKRAELHLPGGHSQATFSARERLLELIEEMTGHVITELQREALPPFLTLMTGMGWVVADAMASRGGRRPFEIVRLKAEGTQGCDELLAALDGWQEKWQLRAPWIEAAVLQALTHWSRRSDTVAEGAWPGEFKQLGWLPQSGEPPSLRGYNPFDETRSSYREEVRATLDAYLENVERDARERLGAENWKEKRSRGSRGTDQHLRWLVRFQVLGEKQQSIADNPTGDGTGRRREMNTLQDALRSTAELVGLKRRTVATPE